MTRFTSFALCAFFGLGAALAQQQSAQPSPEPAPAQAGARHQPPTPEHQAKMLAKRLNLTTDQQAQLLPILSEREQAIQNARNDTTLSAQDRHAKVRAAHEAADSKIQGVLTDAQKAQYNEWKQQMRHRAHSRESSGSGN